MDTAAVRERMKFWLERNGRGAMNQLVSETGLSRTTITLFRDGGNITPETAAAISKVLEAHAAYGAEPEYETIERRVVRDLKYLLATWEDTGTPLQERLEILSDFVRRYRTAIELFRQTLEKE